MSSSYRLDEAELIGAIGETALYGLYLFFAFPATIYVLHKSRKSAGRPLVTSVLFIGSVFLFVQVTVHYILDMSRLHAAFIATQPTPPIDFYARLSEPRGVARVALFCSEIVTLDLLLLYRLYVIWNRTFWVVIPPFITLIATTVSVIIVCIGFANSVVGVDVFGTSTGTWIITAFTLTLCTNLMAVGMIAFKILRRERAFAGVGVSSLKPLLLITIEGAGVYCILNFISMVGCIVHSNVNFTSLAFSSPITGISFCLITLRVGLERVLSDFASSHTASQGRSMNPPQHPMRIQVTRDELRVAEPTTESLELGELKSSFNPPWSRNIV